MSKLNFYRGIESLYNPITHEDGLYFATDTHKIFLNGESYGGTEGKLITDVAPKEDDPSIVVITFSDDTTKEISVGKTKYTSAIEDAEFPVPNAIGGIAAGTKVGELAGKSYDEILDTMLFPTVNPTFTNPSASLSLVAGISSIFEVGAPAPSAAEFKTVFNKGAIELLGKKQANRAGDSVNAFIFFGGDEGNIVLPATVALGDTVYKYKVNYEEGPQPVNNKGEAYSSPLAAGSVVSGECKINGTYPWFATTEQITTLTKQPLVKYTATPGSMTTGEFELVAMSEETKQSFKLPRKATSIKQLNTLSGKFESVALGDWNETTVEESINGNTVTYYLYEYAGDPRGAVTLIVNF